LLFHVIYQITVNSLLAGNAINTGFNCSGWEKSIRQIGFESVVGADAGNGIRVFLPDIGMFMAGLGIWLLCRSTEQKRPAEEMVQYNQDFKTEEQMLFEEDFDAEDEAEDEDEENNEDEEEEEEEEPKESAKMKVLRLVATVASKVKESIGKLITTAGKVVVTILLGLTGMMLPSLTSAVYFFVFLALCTWWSFCRSFDTLLFSCLCVLMAIFSAGHLLVLYLYQFQFFQESIPPDDHYIRVFGISPIVKTDCSYTWRINVNSTKWQHFVNPIMLLVLYYTLATLIRLWLQDPMITVSPAFAIFVLFPCVIFACVAFSFCLMTSQAVVVNTNGTSFGYVTTLNSENGPVSLDLYSTPKYKRDVYEVVEVPPEEDEDKSMEEEEDGTPAALTKVFRFIMKQSYVCALIAMMAWSITYVSWLTFVFLLWSCTLWMVRDRRKYAMLTSPFMVAYGNLLLGLQYIWSWKDMSPVPGLFPESKSEANFWLLLRQTLTERKDKQKEEAVLSEVTADSEKRGRALSKSSVQSGVTSEEMCLCVVEVEKTEADEGGEDDLMQMVGKLVTAVLVKYWIYVCSGMFFFVSFEGTTVMYKIIYMMLFLFCVAFYQVHYEWWRRILKYFWMSVVMYTMLVLILIYTCQFDASIPTWSNITGISPEKLKALGLEKFDLGTLFTSIFIPTSFLLVCILHLHYFHEHFLELTDLNTVAAKQDSAIYRLAHPDGSLADITLMSSSPEPFFEEEQDKEKEVLVMEGVMQEEKEDGSEHQSSQEDLQQESGADPEPPSDQNLKNKWHLVVDRLSVLFLKFLEYFHKLQLFIWWLLEIHIIKIVSSYIILVSVTEVSLLNSVFLAAWAFALPYSQFRPLASSVCTVWTCVVIICKMLYQLETIKPETYSSSCSMPLNYTDEQRKYMNRSVLYLQPVDPANWVGLKKFTSLLPNLRNNLLMLAILAFEVTIYRHQEYFRLRNKLSPPPSRTIFHDITRQHLDHGIINCAKYFINYSFYKFGVEVSFLLAVNVIGQRMDFYSMLHAVALACVMYRRRRKAIAEIWPKYCCFLACMLTFQYFVCIGIPPAACKEYPWRFSAASESNVIKWLYLPDFRTGPNPKFLIYDFMLLLSASLQRQVFDEENKAAVRMMAGDNVEICRDLDAASFSVHNPVPDFIHCRSYLDMLKVIMFSYLFWFVLTIIFITGTTRISIFCMGYLVACFYFLLFGGELLLKPIKKILHYWDFLIAYNVFVISMKNILACGYIRQLLVNCCWLIQLLSLSCTIKDYENLPGTDIHCDLPRDEAGIIWDSICFSFLLLQRRVFMSYYFLHVVADIRAGQILASRGAELFQASIVKAVRARIEEENRSMEQLKKQMESIKIRQQKFKRGKEKLLSMTRESADDQELAPPPEEEDDDGAEKEKIKGHKKPWWRPWVDHASMVRSGDYYLFETDSEDEEDEDDKKEEEPPKKSAFQFVYHAWVTDSRTALKERSKERRHFWKRYSRGRKSRKDKNKGDGSEEKKDGPDNIIKRIFNVLKFTWVLFLTTVDSLTVWINSICREYIDISTVLRIERCMLTREVKKGNVPSRESIHVYYQKQLRLNASRESGLDHISEEDMSSGSLRGRRRRRVCTMESQDSGASRDSMSSEATQCITLFSRQGTNDTIEEVEESPEQAAEPDTVESDTVEPDTRAAGLLYTPDTDAPTTSDVEVPPSYSKAVSFDRLSISSEDNRRLMLMTSDSRSDMEDSLLPSQTTDLTASELLLNKMFYDEELESCECFYKAQPLGLQLCYALYNLLVAHSEMVCYLVIILNHMISASMATLVLPVLIFLWAMLSVPRPSKRFWMTAIVYTEVTIVIKYFFQFGFFPFNQNLEVDRKRPYHPPNIIGVEKKDRYVHYDLVQLLALFFHRSILKCHGLWDEDDPKATKKEDASPHRDESEDEGRAREEERMRSWSPRFGKTAATSFSAGSPQTHAQVHVHSPEQRTYQRRKSSSGGSHLSHHSSLRSKRGSTSTRNSSRRDGREAGVPLKSRRELIAEKLREQLIKARVFLLRKGMEVYHPIRQFFYNLIHPEYSAVTDVYVLMFLADTVDFIIIVFGFWAFGKHQGGADITSSLSEDQVPGPFLVMVLIQFGTMVVDRALYLRKTVMGKVIFQVILVFGIHFWMFFILPGITERRFSQNTVAQLWYFVKCIYFGLSAYQIRCGYPTRVLGNFLTKSYNYVNLFLFQGFRLIPFLTELRAVMDWVWTDTTLSLSSWICVEDIYAHIFVLKCWRESEKRYPQPRGQKKKKVVKYGMGGMIVMLLICIVWFPLLFMSLVKSVAGVVNTPLDVSVSLTLGGFQVCTRTCVCVCVCARPRGGGTAQQFLEAYVYQDVTIAHLEGSSNSLWTISPPSRRNLIGMLNATSDLPLTITWSIQRNLSLGAKAETATGKHIINLDQPTKDSLKELLSGPTNSPVCIKNIFPRYLRAPSDSNAKRIEQLEKDFQNITLTLDRGNSSEGKIQEWWIVNQTEPGPIVLKTVDYAQAGLELYIISDQVSPPSLGFLAGYGIMGLYMSVVLVIGKFVREFFSGISHTIMFEELPNVDRILKLCTDIFLVRETGELDLEEDLYAKLIFLYRSPETMIKWTREKNK
uniref:Piezo-type mechanosensitive ion channel component n=1 Tax=Electrophorus electricus TaxID=8005 RepID=A0AAY5F1Q2_ELEEL